eukprot:scaffold17004_cov67-Isochrysis_galbana.AAC.2
MAAHIRKSSSAKALSCLRSNAGRCSRAFRQCRPHHRFCCRSKYGSTGAVEMDGGAESTSADAPSVGKGTVLLTERYPPVRSAAPLPARLPEAALSATADGAPPTGLGSSAPFTAARPAFPLLERLAGGCADPRLMAGGERRVQPVHQSAPA